MNKNLNYYKILNISWDCGPKEIKKSYRDLSKIHHPDKNGGDDTEFTKIVEAYKILSNDALKLDYDNKSQFGKTYNESLELYNFEFSNSNIKDDRFAKDLDKFKKEMIDILIKLKEFRDTITYDRLISCKTCDSTGMDFEDDMYIFECDLCEGEGEWNDKRCPSCKGKGESSIKKCGSCDGKKLIEINETIRLKEDRFKDGKCKVEFKGNASKEEFGKVGSLFILIE